MYSNVGALVKKAQRQDDIISFWENLYLAYIGCPHNNSIILIALFNTNKEDSNYF